jgi:nicotinamide-nucleotide amidase
MKAEIIAVGTELLLGQIVNTNAQFLSQQLAELGVNVYFQTVVGDNAARIEEAVRLAASRSDLVICTGGLGPTQDDITKDVLAGVCGMALGFHEPSLAKIKRYYEERGLPMPESNARQATLPEGADPLPNDNGMAVGAAWTRDGVHYLVLPGPPRELVPMFAHYAKPWIVERLDDSRPLHSRNLKFCGIGESALEQALIDLIEGQRDVTIAPYAKEGEVTIRLTVRAADRTEAEAKFAPIGEEIRRRVGRYLFAEEDIPLEEALVRLLAERGLTLAAAESCTGGLLAELITSVPGSSRVFKGGVVAYTPEVKRDLLHVPERVLTGPDAPGTVSRECALAMAHHVRRLAGSDLAAAITGVAGPDPSEGKPVGLVYIAIADAAGETVVEGRFQGNREGVRLRAAKNAMYHLWRRVVGTEP